jgi:Leucine-rich repeat (LRR) protein
MTEKKATLSAIPKLTPAIISGKYGTPGEVIKIEFSNRDIEELDDLSPCVELKKVDLRNNKLSSLEGLNFNKEITDLNISGNQFNSLEDVKNMTKMKGNERFLIG